MSKVEKTTPAQAVNESQTQPNVEVKPEIKISDVVVETPSVIEPKTEQVDGFKTEDESKETHLEPWMKARLEREQTKTQKEREEKQKLEHEIMMMRLNQQNQFQNVQSNTQSEVPSDDPLEIIKKVVKDTIIESEREHTERFSREEERRKAADFKQKLMQGRAKYDDFDEVVLNPSAPVSPEVAMFMQAIPNADDFAYNLIKHNSDKLQEINKMHPALRIVEANKLYQDFMAKKHRKTVSNAPIPPSTSVTQTSGTKPVNDMTYDEIWAAINPGRKRN